MKLLKIMMASVVLAALSVPVYATCPTPDWPCEYQQQNQTQSQNPTQNNNQTTNQSQSTTNSSTGGNSTANDNSTTTYVTPRVVSSAIAAPLTSGQDTCMGSLSGGAQTGVFGLSLGSTKRDSNCIMIKQVKLLQQLGFPSAACYRARMGKDGHDIDEAMRKAGIDCSKLAIPVPASTDVVTHEELKAHEDRIISKVLDK